MKMRFKVQSVYMICIMISLSGCLFMRPDVKYKIGNKKVSISEEPGPGFIYTSVNIKMGRDSMILYINNCLNKPNSFSKDITVKNKHRKVVYSFYGVTDTANGEYTIYKNKILINNEKNKPLIPLTDIEKDFISKIPYEKYSDSCRCYSYKKIIGYIFNDSTVYRR